MGVPSMIRRGSSRCQPRGLAVVSGVQQYLNESVPDEEDRGLLNQLVRLPSGLEVDLPAASDKSSRALTRRRAMRTGQHREDSLVPEPSSTK